MGALRLSILLLCVVAAVAADRVSRVGNAIRSSSSGVDIAGATFLINDIVLAEGVLFAFRAYFRSDAPVRFQIWRPTSGDSHGTFKLISDTKVIPSLVNEVEDIYLAAKLVDCTLVHHGDRLGLSFEDTPGAVAYTFDGTDPKAFATQVDPSTPLESNIVLTFDTLVFPYDFSVAAYVDTDINGYTIDEGSNFVTCPNDLLIPDVDIVADLTPAPPVTGAPGAPGATGPAGPQGETGPQGPTGQNGAKGMTGATGPAGVTGDTGATGIMGATGPQGINGLIGATGHQGPRGERGEQGLPGPPGPVVDAEGNPVPISLSNESTSGDMMNYILMAWIGILTIVVIVVVIILIVVMKRRSRPDEDINAIEKQPETPNFRKSYPGQSMMWDADGASTTVSPPNSNEQVASSHTLSNDLASGHEDQESWMGTLKSSSELCYSSETLNTQDGSKHPWDVEGVRVATSRGEDDVSITVSDAPILS